MSSVVVEELKQAPPVGKKAVLLFYAEWHEATPAMSDVLQALASSTPDVLFAKVAAESNSALSKQYQVTAVPTFVLLHTNGSVASKMEGATHLIPTLTQAVLRLVNNDDHHDNTKDAPAATASVGNDDDDTALTTRLQALIRSAPVMLFIKGSPTAPRCGFSRQAVELLQEEHIPFGSFDILQDDAVRQGLKKHSDWPTYPQLYVKGELMGGLDILKEIKSESLSLQNGLGLSDDDLAHFTSQQQSAEEPKSLNDRIKEIIHQNRVMLFMKGLPSAPRCGFSRQMVQLLESEGISYGSFDILTDEEVRQGLKKYSDWPTYPQLYVNGELIGGLDIVQEMHLDGTLKEALA